MVEAKQAIEDEDDFSLTWAFPSLSSLRVCLFGGEIGWMKNFGKKMGRKTFWSVFGWMGRKENKW